MRGVGFIIALSLFGMCPLTSSAQHAPTILGAERIAERSGTPTAAEGRVLISELGCAACHEFPAVASYARDTAPDLADVASRVTPGYLRAWLGAPHDTKPGTAMPDVLPTGPERDETVEALAVFLTGQGTEWTPTALPNDEEGINNGERLYHSVGCVACHEPFRDPTPRIGGDDEYSEQIVEHQAIALPSVPLPNLRTKTTVHALAEFLMDPLAVRPSGRMPNMKLHPDEAKAISAYLLTRFDDTRERPETIAHNQAMLERGRAAFTELGCAACHAAGESVARQKLNIDIQNTMNGCLSEDRTTAPWYGLSNRQRDAIRRALEDRGQPDPPQILREHLAALNCLACHVRDDLGGIENGRLPYFTATIEADLGDEGRVPPPLTGVGAKLTETGLTSMLVGDASVRSYMATRMPRFGEAQVGELPEAFLSVDENPNAPEIDVSGLLLHHRNRYGRDLMGTNGFGCVGCHNLYGAKSLGIPAIDLATVPDRIQPSWFKQYLLDPSALRPGTRMPTYFEENTSPVSRVLRGNVDQQIEALWIYLREIDQTRLPVGMEDRGDFELKPEDRPIVLRTFMTGVGTHAIAVGYPAGVHVAFDALNVRLALAWRGQFIDAESTWADRFSPLASPMSDERFEFPEGPAVAFANVDADATDTRFLGYRLDAGGVPTFLYSLSSPDETVKIEEYVAGQDNGTVVRRFTITGNTRSTLHIANPQSPEQPTVVPPSSESTTVEQVWRPAW